MELNFKVFGEGEPVIIMHGMFGTLDNWQTIAKKLAKNYMVFIVDLRNHGRSPHSEEFSYTIMAEDIKEFMESNWVFKAHIVGHSMGGKVAMQFATEHPDMVDKLCIVDIAPKAYKGNHQSIFEALFAIDLDKIHSRQEANHFLQERIPDYGVRQFILKNLSINKNSGKYEWKMNLPVIHNSYQHILGESVLKEQFEGTTLFIGGSNSKYIIPDETTNYKTYFPNAEFTWIQNAGHWVHAEQPKLFLDKLEQFLQN